MEPRQNKAPATEANGHRGKDSIPMRKRFVKITQTKRADAKREGMEMLIAPFESPKDWRLKRLVKDLTRHGHPHAVVKATDGTLEIWGASLKSRP